MSNGARNQVIDLTSSGGGRHIAALAIVANPSAIGVLMYVAFDDHKDRIRLIKWSTLADNDAYSRGLLAGTESDELFFKVDSDVFSISILWSSSLQPIFLAKAKPASDNAALIYTADNIQRTFTKVQGMTHSTHPSLGPLGVELGASGLMVASSGGNIFSIAINRCMPFTSNDIPRYWNGKTCVDHVCVRPRSCTASDGSQTWDPILLRCVCSPGYYGTDTTSGLSCLPCEAKITVDSVPGFFCLNNTKISCPNGLPNNIAKAKSPADCSCADGYYFSDTGLCVYCPIGKWCPNKWNVFDCPGSAGSQTGSGGAVYPTSCICSPGHVGPNCLLCPGGRVCLSQNSLTSNLVKNVAMLLNVNLYNYDTTRQLTNQMIEDDICNDILANNLFTIFSKWNLDYLSNPDLLRLRYFCKFIPASYHSSTMFVTMIQLNNADDVGNSIGNSMKVALSSYNSSYMTILEISQTSIVNSIANNTEAICPVGKVPNDARVLCICAAGYASSSSTLLCTQCIPGFYKPNSGFGTCISCPIGTTSKAGSSFCTNILDGTVATQSTVNNNNLPIIVGGVIGGVILVGLLIFGMARITSSV
jgi:hypothetical protein